MVEKENSPLGEVGRSGAGAAAAAPLRGRAQRADEVDAPRGDWMVLAGLVVLAIIIGVVFAVILSAGADLG